MDTCESCIFLLDLFCARDYNYLEPTYVRKNVNNNNNNNIYFYSCRKFTCFVIIIVMPPLLDKRWLNNKALSLSVYSSVTNHSLE